MASDPVPTIQIIGSSSLGTNVEAEWQGLVKKNLGDQVEQIYKEETLSSCFDRAQSEREELQKATKLLASELKEKNRNGIDFENVRSFDELADAVNKAAIAWGDRKRFFPKAQDKIRAFAAQSLQYEGLLNMIPSENMYTSIICGAIKALVHAATVYNKTAEDLADGLLDVTAAAKNVSDQRLLLHTTHMRECVTVFYAHILRFCSVAVNWYRTKPIKRLLQSFKKDSEVASVVQAIKKQADLIRDTVLTGDMARNLVMHQEMRQYALALKADLEELKLQHMAAHIHLKVYRKNVIVIQRGSSRNRALRRASKTPEDPVPQEQTISQTPVLHTYDRLQVTESMREAFGRQQHDPSQELRALLKNGVIPRGFRKSFKQRLDSWTTGKESEFLWIHGNLERQKVSSLTALAARIVDSAIFSGMRVAFHSCRASDRNPINASIQGLILQLLECETGDIETTVDLSAERLAHIENASFDTAWAFFQEIVYLGVARRTFIIVDGLDKLREKDAGAAKSFVTGLHALTLSGHSQKILKVILTTNRKAATMFKELPEECGLRFDCTSQQGGRQSLRRGRYSQFSNSDSEDAESVSQENNTDDDSETDEAQRDTQSDVNTGHGKEWSSDSEGK